MTALLWVLLALCSLVLTNVNETIFGSLQENQWDMLYYNLSQPANVVSWLIISLGVLSGVILASHISRPMHGRRFTPIRFIFGVVASGVVLLGGEVASIMVSIDPVFAKEDLTSRWQTCIGIFNTNASLVSHLASGTLIALLGLWLARPLLFGTTSRTANLIMVGLSRAFAKCFGQDRARKYFQSYWRASRAA